MISDLLRTEQQFRQDPALRVSLSKALMEPGLIAAFQVLLNNGAYAHLHPGSSAQEASNIAFTTKGVHFTIGRLVQMQMENPPEMQRGPTINFTGQEIPLSLLPKELQSITPQYPPGFEKPADPFTKPKS